MQTSVAVFGRQVCSNALGSPQASMNCLIITELENHFSYNLRVPAFVLILCHGDEAQSLVFMWVLLGNKLI